MPGTKKSGSGHSNSTAVKPAVFPIVGIGASAGGLAAFEAFFSGMPACSVNPTALTSYEPFCSVSCRKLRAARVRCTHGLSKNGTRHSRR
jgi:hypothetical protein